MQPGCRVPRHDVVQVSHMLIFNVLITIIGTVSVVLLAVQTDI